MMEWLNIEKDQIEPSTLTANVESQMKIPLAAGVNPYVKTYIKWIYIGGLNLGSRLILSLSTVQLRQIQLLRLVDTNPNQLPELDLCSCESKHCLKIDGL